MIIVHSDSVPAEPIPAVELKTLFPFGLVEGGRSRFGKLVLPPKARLPLSGLAPHDEDEYSIVVKGQMTTTIGDREYRLCAGDATFIPAGEAHAVYNPGDEECHLVWVLVRR
jgi:mannose-6-phosphate isomerase-like protein (cupin superfamily)